MNLASQPEDIDACNTLFLFSIAERDQNTLAIVLDEGIASPAAQVLPVAGETIKNVHAVEVTPVARRFEFYWDSYISYTVRNESYAKRHKWEVSSGGKFLIFSKSAFLDYIVAATIAQQDFPGPFVHYSILCANHIIDVASQGPPTVRKLERVY